MACSCGEGTCNCCNSCQCQTHSCPCKTCINLRNGQQPIIESPNKQNKGQNTSQSRKRSQSDRSNEQVSSFVSDSPPGKSQRIQSSASGFDSPIQTVGSSVSVARVAPPQNVAGQNPLLSKLLVCSSMQGHSDNPSASEGDNPSASEGDNPSASEGDNPSASEGDNPSASEGDNPSASEGDNPSASEGDNQIF